MTELVQCHGEEIVAADARTRVRVEGEGGRRAVEGYVTVECTIVGEQAEHFGGGPRQAKSAAVGRINGRQRC